MSPRPVAIDIWSDVMCPWCVIGTRQLETALAGMTDEIAATIRFHPFELNPDMPPEGEDQRAHIMRKYGRSADEAAQGRERLREVGRQAGYAFDYTGPGEPPPAKMWNTRLAHTLLVMALRDHGPQVQGRLKHALFDAHFQARRNVGDAHVLIDIATAVGIDPDAARAALDDAELDAIVTAGEQQAWDWNITGVPAMIINGKYLISGAQDPATYANALRRVVAKDASALDQP
jgi:predicted DsbA family dithiol-disulfide isomerase